LNINVKLKRIALLLPFVLLQSYLAQCSVTFKYPQPKQNSYKNSVYICYATESKGPQLKRLQPGFSISIPLRAFIFDVAFILEYKEKNKTTAYLQARLPSKAITKNKTFTLIFPKNLHNDFALSYNKKIKFRIGTTFLPAFSSRAQKIEKKYKTKQ